MTNGVDLYTKYQTVTSWEALRASGRTFAYFKGTDGMATRSTADWPTQARRVGIACGLYGYAQPGNARDQYDLLYQTSRDRVAVDLSPALDLEDPFVPGNAAVQFAVAWLLRAIERGQLPVYYANDSMMTYTLPAIRAAVPGVWPWIARYGAPPKNAYRTWQHSSSGQVPGIVASGVDLNQGDAPIMITGPAPSPTPSPSGETEYEMNRVDLKAIPSGGYVELDMPGGARSAITIYPGKEPVWVGNIYFWGEGHVFGNNQTGGMGQQTNPSPGPDALKVDAIRTFTVPNALLAQVEFSSNSDFHIIAKG